MTVNTSVPFSDWPLSGPVRMDAVKADVQLSVPWLADAAWGVALPLAEAPAANAELAIRAPVTKNFLHIIPSSFSNVIHGTPIMSRGPIDLISLAYWRFRL
ncbi:MAG: hypothetical protein ACLP0J_06130 [Solirubrobacteraceae bacterium]